LIVVGGETGPVEAGIADALLRERVRHLAGRAERFGSVCAGVFLLAAFGVLSGRRVTTHWQAHDRLARRFPDLRVEDQALYINDGPLWTSAGVSGGIDMTLAMVEQDLGPEVVATVARSLVLHAYRPGYQSQFSPLLAAQTQAQAPFAELLAWIHENLDADLRGPRLARKVRLSERSFYRKFAKVTGLTPARYVESVRLDAARSLLGRGLPVKSVARSAGFKSAATFSAAFERRFGVGPRTFQILHGPGSL
jgi:transcriptional regulator GlxA family with amidase domain